MKIRKAEEKDIERIGILLKQVNNVHANGRPDIFKYDERKYTNEELKKLLKDENTLVFVAVNEEDVCCGYAFCFYSVTKDGTNLVPHSSIYIDDLCVDSECRSMGIGTLLYNYVVDTAKKKGCYNITLNVWSFNESAMRFYEKCGLKPLKTVMETVLTEE